MASDDQASHDPPRGDDAAQRPQDQRADDAARQPQAPLTDDRGRRAQGLSPGAVEELKGLLTTVLSALPSEMLDRLARSRVAFFAGDDRALRREPILIEIGGRSFAPELFPSGFLYLNSSQLLEHRSPQESQFLVARKVAEILLWLERDTAQPTLDDFVQAAEERARRWGFERPRVMTVLERLRRIIGRRDPS